jgi:hypothetical protein
VRARRGTRGGGTRGGGKLVYTRPGRDAYADKLVIEEVPPPAEAKPSEPVRVCPHGGIYIGEIAICGECAHASQTTEDVFGAALLDIARKASWSVRVRTETPDDCAMVAVLAMLGNRKRILTAKSPAAMAMTIAQRAIQKLYRKNIPLAVSQMSFGGSEDGNRNIDPTTSQRLGWLEMEGFKPIWSDPNDFGPDPEAWSPWSKQSYERIRTIPGINLLWTAENFRRVQIFLDEAKALLPTRPFSVWSVINLHFGINEGQSKLTWEVIAAELSPSWKPLTARQVRYACQEGLKQMRVYLLQKLLPANAFKSLT